jgi:hypothetical protein
LFTASAFFTGYRMNAYSDAFFGSTTVRQAKTKSWAVTGLPSAHRASLRSQNVAPSSRSSQRSATPGTISPDGP